MNRLRAATAFTFVVLRQMVQDRTALFFTVALPIAIIVIIGTTFGGEGRIRVGLVVEQNSDIATRLEDRLADADGVEVVRYDTADELRRAVRRFSVEAGLVVPADADALLAGTGAAGIGLLTLGASEDTVAVRRTLQGVIDDVGAPLGAAVFAATQAGVPLDEALARADAAADPAGGAGGITVTTTDVGDGIDRNVGRFAFTAPQNLVLFTFITALTSATVLVRARRSGILRRALASPTGLGVQLAGMAAGWFTLCLLQSVLIVMVGAVAFGVPWGDPVAASLLVVTFALVGCGAGLLVGAIGANEDRVGAITPIVGMVLGALGGCMVPAEIFPPSMLMVARMVPHYWAMRAWQSLIFDGAGLGAIAGDLAVLAVAGAALVVVATLLMRRSLLAGR
ncbi:MAG: ABC transporter permease [Acidimicrobiia bacterium]|nr:ABC transporter permease [Acidimicrobiia bacterium]